MAEALDDDLNAPRAVAAVFAFAGGGNAAMDAGQAPGPATVAAWQRVEGVLGVTSAVTAIRITGSEGDGGTALAEEPPPGADENGQRAWALGWAVRRKQAKSSRNFAEADRIRDRLKSAGWEVRDGRDGSVEVVRR